MKLGWYWVLFALCTHVLTGENPARDVRISEDVLDLYHDLSRQEKKNPPRILIFKVDSADSIWAVKKDRSNAFGSDQEAWNHFVNTMKSFKQPRFGVLNYRENVVFVSWIPFEAPMELQIRYRNTLDPFKNSLSGIGVYLEAKSIRKAVVVSMTKACDAVPKPAPHITGPDKVMDLTLECVEEVKCTGYGAQRSPGPNGVQMTFFTYEDKNITTGSVSGACNRIDIAYVGFNQTLVDVKVNDAQRKISMPKSSQASVTSNHAPINKSESNEPVEESEYNEMYLQSETGVGNLGASTQENLKSRTASSLLEALPLPNKISILLILGVFSSLIYQAVCSILRKQTTSNLQPLLIEARL